MLIGHVTADEGIDEDYEEEIMLDVGAEVGNASHDTIAVTSHILSFSYTSNFSQF